jgi:beta-mannanase
VLIRLFGGEFNGSWWYGQSPLANHNLTPADFVAAWRRVVDIFREVGAANVSFAWIPVVYPDHPVTWVDSDIAAYYPGDSYVDWVGADTGDSRHHLGSIPPMPSRSPTPSRSSLPSGASAIRRAR